MNRPVGRGPAGVARLNGGSGRPSALASFRPRHDTSAAAPQGAGSAPSRLQYTSSGIAQRSGTTTSPTWCAGLTPPAMPDISRRCTLKWSTISCVTMAELTMLTPLSTMTTGLPRSTPVVKRLPFSTQVRAERVCATRIAASWPKAETMPMRGVHSVRQAPRDAGRAAQADARPRASKAATNRFFTGGSGRKKKGGRAGLESRAAADVANLRTWP